MLLKLDDFELLAHSYFFTNKNGTAYIRVSSTIIFKYTPPETQYSQITDEIELNDVNTAFLNHRDPKFGHGLSH